MSRSLALLDDCKAHGLIGLILFELRVNQVSHVVFLQLEKIRPMRRKLSRMNDAESSLAWFKLPPEYCSHAPIIQKNGSSFFFLMASAAFHDTPSAGGIGGVGGANKQNLGLGKVIAGVAHPAVASLRRVRNQNGTLQLGGAQDGAPLAQSEDGVPALQGRFGEETCGGQETKKLQWEIARARPNHTSRVSVPTQLKCFIST